MKSKLNILILTMIALGFALTFGAPRSWAQGVDNPAVFELDGNTQDNAAAGLDWESAFPPGTPLTANPIQDPAPLTIYTTGGSKDINNVSQWRHKSGGLFRRVALRQQRRCRHRPLVLPAERRSATRRDFRTHQPH